MKMVVVGLLTVAMAFMVNAASVMWTVSNIETLNTADGPVTIGGDNYKGFTAYLVDSSLGINDFFTSLDAGTLGSDAATTGKILEQTGITEGGRGTKTYGVILDPSQNTSSYNENQTYNFYSVIVDPTGKYYLKTADVEASTASSTVAIPMQWQAKDISGLTWTSVPGGGGTGGEGAPEPTSGLLLLVGGALLALRRKRK